MSNRSIFHDSGGAGQRRLADRTFVVIAALVLVIGIVALIGWFLDLSSSSADSVPDQNPIPNAQLPESSIELARQFRTYVGVVPVLSYSGIDEAGSGAQMTSADFQLQMTMLDDAEFSTVTLEQVRSLVLGERVTLPANPVLITFDSASVRLWTDVDPILGSHGFSGVLFLTSDDVAISSGPSDLNLATLKAMKSSGRWEFGSHLEASVLVRRASESLTAWETRIRSMLLATSDNIDAALDVNPIAMSYPYSDAGLPDDDPAVASRLPELVGERYDLGFLDTRSSTVVSALVDKTMVPRLPENRISISPNALLGAIEESVPRQPKGALDALRWTVIGQGSCLYAERTLVISADGTTTCLLESEIRSSWEDIEFSGILSGVSPITTATVQLRATALSRIEVVLQPDAVIVQKQSEGVWSQVIRESMESSEINGPQAFLVRLRGSLLTVVIAGRPVVTADVGPSSNPGQVSIGAVGDQADVVTVTELTIAAPIGA